ncbi:MAG: M36 family metallopeptidase [Pirellulaceae bacterium]
MIATKARLSIERLECRRLLAVDSSFELPMQHLREVDRLLSEPNSGLPAEIAMQFLRDNASRMGLAAVDLSYFNVTDQYTSPHNGVTHLYLQQTYNDLPIDTAWINVNVMPDGRIINVGSSFMAGLVEPAFPTARQPARPRLSAESAAESLIEELQLDGDLAMGQPMTLLYVPIAIDAVRLAWRIDIPSTGNSHGYQASVDAWTGEVLHVSDHDPHHAGDYTVFPLPLDSPLDGDRLLSPVVADAVASPYGWHDINGIEGADFTDTRGNNVFVQEDRDANNNDGLRADGGDDLNFDFPFDPNESLDFNLNAALANAFHTVNVLHDVHYQYGFDEAAGNFQMNNYDRGGIGNDPVIVDVQDGGGRSNATFATSPDGTSSRLELFVWDAAASILVHSAPPNSDPFQATEAGFGPQAPIAGVSSHVVMAEPADACTALSNAEQASGGIVLIDRGTCFFDDKVKRAQDAGAVAVIIANNVDGPLITMSGDDPTVNIPSFFVTRETGDAFKSLMASQSLELTVFAGLLDLDSAFDNGIIVHEYGHGVSQRLTAGPQNVSALGGIQSGGMGEGWSDWWALMFTQNADQRRDDPALWRIT